MECRPGISIDPTSLVHSREEAIWFRVAGIVLFLPIAHYKIPCCEEIHCKPYRTTVVKDLPVSGPPRLPCYKQFCSIVTHFCRQHICASGAVKTMAYKRPIGQVTHSDNNYATVYYPRTASCCINIASYHYSVQLLNYSYTLPRLCEGSQTLNQLK